MIPLFLENGRKMDFISHHRRKGQLVVVTRENALPNYDKEFSTDFERDDIFSDARTAHFATRFSEEERDLLTQQSRILVIDFCQNWNIERNTGNTSQIVKISSFSFIFDHDYGSAPPIPSQDFLAPLYSMRSIC